LLSWADLEGLLDVQSVIEAVQRGFAAYSAGKVEMPLRTGVQLKDPPGVLRLMPCAMTEERVLGTKLVWAYQDNPKRGLPTIGALYVLSDYETGFPRAVMDAGFITGLRTAAASAVATRWLAREEARTLGIFGTGVQGEFHALAIPAIRQIERILVWGRSPEKSLEFSERMQHRCQARLEAGESAEAVAAADILVTGTTSHEPLFPGQAVQPGAHVNGVGSHAPKVRELDSDLVANSRIVVDTYEAAFAEAGDLLLPIEEGRIDRDHVAAELGEVVLGTKPGRQRPDQITLFKSCGAAFQDAVTASLALERARQSGVGQEFKFA
jgi:ornithine cyclodeaminase/alanine dehydrogenase-like protein (mu-crystallin family)